jgi:hypothetical protein
MFDCQLHTNVPWTLLQELSQFFLFENFEEASVFWYGYASPIWLAASEADIAVGGLDLLAEHVWPQELTLVGAEFAFGKCCQIENGEDSVAILYLHVLVVVYAATVGTAADYA